MNYIGNINLNIKKNIIVIISFLILLQPIIDLLVGISINTNFIPSTMSLIRIIIIMFLLHYFVFINKSPSKNKISLFLGIIAVYLILYFINMNFSLSELKSAIKVFYFPILFVILYSIFEEEKKFIDTKYLLISLFIYASIIIIGYITNTAFESYDVSKVGTSGYFYAANEIGGIMAILMPFVYNYVFNKINIKKIIYFIIIISAVIMMGTKTPVISIIICTIYFVGRLINRNNAVKVISISIISILILSILITKTPIYKNLVIHAEFLNITNITEVIENPKVFDHFFLGSRLKFLDKNTDTYLNSDLDNKLLGIGYKEDPKLSEMDFNDILYRQGLIGFLVYFGILCYLILYNIKKYNKNYILPVILIIIIASIVGHIITAAAVAIFVSIILYGFIKEDKI